jgi:hypothetical protein
MDMINIITVQLLGHQTNLVQGLTIQKTET